MLLGHLPDGAVEGLLQKASEPGEMPLQVKGLRYFPHWSEILARAPSQ